MEHHLHIRQDLRLGLFRFGPRLSLPEAAELFVRHVERADFDPNFAMLCDLRALREIEAIFFRVARLAPKLAAFQSPVVSSALVPDATVFGYARMLEQILSLSSPIRAHPVHRAQEALALTGRPEADFDALFAFQP
jgi:hypothetical protein